MKNLSLQINSIGDSQCRPYYKKLLVSYFKSREHALCADCRRRLRENPLRILDCKEEKCQPIKAQAPQMIDHLCEECHKHFKEVLEFLEEIELPYQLNPYLVRGLDYYTRTVFEIFEEGKGSALVGGGRYDALGKFLGRRNISASGAAGGVERIMQVMKEKNIKLPEITPPQVFLAQLGGLAKRKSVKIVEDFRKIKVQVAESFGRDSLKAQLTRADKLGVKYTLILGQKEALEGTVILRDMANGRQDNIKMEKVVAEVKKRLKK